MKTETAVLIQKHDRQLSIVFAMIIFLQFITNASDLVSKLTGISSSMVSLMCKLVILAALFYLLPTIYFRFNRPLGFFLLSSGGIVTVNYLFFSDNPYFMANVTTFLITILPMVVLILEIEEKTCLLEALHKASLCIAVICVLLILMYPVIVTSKFKYSMGFSNSLILPAIVLTSVVFEKDKPLWKKVSALIACMALTAAATIYGSRGALISIAVFFVYCLLFIYRPHNTSGLIMKFGGTTLILTGILFYRQILLLLYELTLSFGYTNRTLRLLATQAGHDSGRIDIWMQVIREIKAHPFAVRGINADYILLKGYCHNIFLDFSYNFGLILGVPLCIAIVVLILRSLRYAGVPHSRLQTVMLFSTFPTLLWSESVWTFTLFWLWLVLAVKDLRITWVRRVA
ncbi:MAG: hypothetical protein J5518_01875 [Lachnospiraceae bacterium]|nr:hypothetical protein [Lachnospiraceae bacterium]